MKKKAALAEATRLAETIRLRHRPYHSGHATDRNLREVATERDATALTRLLRKLDNHYQEK